VTIPDTALSFSDIFTVNCQKSLSDLLSIKSYGTVFIAISTIGTISASVMRKTGSSRGLVVGAPGQACRFAFTQLNYKPLGVKK
jgi:hypothetical protein